MDENSSQMPGVTPVPEPTPTQEPTPAPMPVQEPATTPVAPTAEPVPASEPATAPVAPTPEQVPTQQPVQQTIQQPAQQPAQQPEQPAKKKNNLVLIILIAAIVVVGAVFAVMMIMSNQESKTPATTSSSTSSTSSSDADTDEDDSDPAVDAEAQNTEIINALTLVNKSMNNFMANNRGQLPTTSTSDTVRGWDAFVKNYLDTATTGEETFSSKYKTVYCEFGSSNCKASSKLSWETDKNTIYIATKATCKDDVAVASNGARKIAIYAALNPAAYKKSSTTPKTVACLSN